MGTAIHVAWRETSNRFPAPAADATWTAKCVNCLYEHPTNGPVAALGKAARHALQYGHLVKSYKLGYEDETIHWTQGTNKRDLEEPDF